MNQGLITKKLRSVRRAARTLRGLSYQKKNRVLVDAADLLHSRSKAILAANLRDLNALGETTPAFRDRLTLNGARLAQMEESLRQIAKLVDPVGEVVEQRSLKNGVRLRKVRSPLGVIFMIFESRPNVAIEAFSLAFKSGNVILLRGGRESMQTTQVLFKLLSDALKKNGVPTDCLWGITNPDRALTAFLLKQKSLIDVVVPRGGDGLIRYVVENSQIPIIKNDRGLCHVFVNADADQEMAVRIVRNAKTQRPGVCNSMETLLVHEKIASKFLPRVYDALSDVGVEWFACPKSATILRGKPLVRRATSESWDTEYLDLKINCRIVRNIDEAIEHIELHGSRHSEAIVTKSAKDAKRFESEIDCAAVYWNASTRFTDGFELGLGGELGISTQKLHVRGPVGLRELTSVRWILEGDGQVRG